MRSSEPGESVALAIQRPVRQVAELGTLDAGNHLYVFIHASGTGSDHHSR
jgi:hypothetical protein